MVNLADGQFQLNGVRFGRNTKLPVSGFDMGSYGVNATDYQVARADELRFGIDTLQPTSITFTIGVLHQVLLPHMVPLAHISSVSNMSDGYAAMESLATAWKSDTTRQQYGYTDTLYYGCRGQTLQIYGRPRKFAHPAKSRLAQFRMATAEFQRVDTLCYADLNGIVTVLPGTEGVTTQNIIRSGGGAPTWVQIFITGPINHPKIKIAGLPLIDINFNLAAGKLIEVNTYPWTRRVVNSDAQNLSPLLVSGSPYLDQIKIPPNATTGVGLSGGSTTGATNAVVLWREAYNSL